MEKQNKDYIMTINEINCGNINEYWLELTNKKTKLTQTLVSKNKESINLMDYDLNFIASKLKKWGIPQQKVYKKIF